MKRIILATLMSLLLFMMTMPVFMVNNQASVSAQEVSSAAGTEMQAQDNVKGDKAMAAAIVVGIAAAAGAVAMGMAIAKSADAISRQPEADGKIRTTLMLGLVFVETAIIYALIIGILIIFVL